MPKPPPEPPKPFDGKLPPPSMGSLFTRILAMYTGASTDVDKWKAGERVVDLVDATPILNDKALAITMVDRIVFLVIAGLVRQAALRLAGWLVEHGMLRSLRVALAAYGIAYTFLILLLVACVTVSDSVLRIAVNYLNPNANSRYAVAHLIVTWMVLLVGISVLYAEQASTRFRDPVRMTRSEKDDIVQNLTAVTFFVFAIQAFQIMVV